MLYLRPTFTCPASGQNTSQQQWDLAFLTIDEFKEKYGLNTQQRDDLLNSRTVLLERRSRLT